MRKPLEYLLVLLAVIATAMTGCSKLEEAGDIDEVAWNAEFAVPVVHGKLSLQDILDELDDFSFLKVNTDGSMNLYYEDEPLSRQLSDLLEEIPDFPIVLNDTVTNLPFDLFDNLSVSGLMLTEGSLSFEFSSSFVEDIDVSLSIPSLTRNGQPLQIDLRIPYQGSLPATASIDPVSLEGYALSAAGNTLELRYDARKLNGERVELDYISGQALDWAYSVIEGVWTNELFELKEDSIDINLFDDWVSGELTLADPRLIIDIDNSFGFATRVRINKAEVTTREGNKLALESSLLSQGFDLQYPSLNEQGQSKRTSFIFTRSNSNIDEIMNSRPVNVVYELIAEIDPEVSGQTGFLSANSEISTAVRVDIPLYGTASGFTIENETAIDLDDLDEVESAEFKLLTSNAIPADFDIQLYFLNAGGQIIDSLFSLPHAVFRAATVDQNGNVTESSVEESYIDISADRFDLLRQSEELRIRAAFSTYNNGQQPVRILSTQELDVKLGVKAKVQ